MTKIKDPVYIQQLINNKEMLSVQYEQKSIIHNSMERANLELKEFISNLYKVKALNYKLINLYK